MNEPFNQYPPANVLRPIVLTPEFHPKKWGGELWICNNNEFCGKILEFNTGAKFSVHFHHYKREVFYVLEGKIKLTTINTENANETILILGVGDAVEISRLLPHQITALENSKIIEFSTEHLEEDSYRVAPGDSQK